MRVEAVPIIRLSVESMKASILQHMGAAGSELGEVISAEIDKTMKNYPWESEVSDIVRAEVRRQIEAYFKYGNGATAINAALDKVFQLPEQTP